MPFKYNPGDGLGPVQAGLPGVLPEEAPLPSEQVLDGGVLSRRLKEAHAQLKGLLLERPAEFTPELWRVAVATVSPPAAHLGRSPGTPARNLGVMQAARDCFPGLSPSAALRRFREAQRDPLVAGFVAEFRALELLDVREQRGMLREAYTASILRGSDALYAIDPAVSPSEWARVSLAVTAAAKALQDMDGLALRPAEVEAVTATATSSDDPDAADQAAALAEKVGRVAGDLRARARQAEPAEA